VEVAYVPSENEFLFSKWRILVPLHTFCSILSISATEILSLCQSAGLTFMTANLNLYSDKCHTSTHRSKAKF